MYHPLKAVGSKPERIRQLAPYYQRGAIWHNEANCNTLEGQLLSFDRSKYWDVMDALAYIIKVMAEFSIFFDPSGDDDLESLEVPNEVMFADLSNEPALVGDYLRV